LIALAACRCGGRRFWHVANSGISVAERRDRLLVEVAVQLLVCTGCSAASWFCATPDGASVGELDAFLGPRRACAACRRPSMAPTPFFVEKKPAEILVCARGPLAGAGSYQLAVCRDCRRAEFYASRLESLLSQPVPGLPSVDSECLRCEARRGWQQIRLQWFDGAATHVLTPSPDGNGHFDARVCRSCGHAAMRAAIARPPTGASTLEAPPDPSSSGPYR
jgi:hypothetical protein